MRFDIYIRCRPKIDFLLVLPRVHHMNDKCLRAHGSKNEYCSSECGMRNRQNNDVCCGGRQSTQRYLKEFFMEIP